MKYKEDERILYKSSDTVYIITSVDYVSKRYGICSVKEFEVCGSLWESTYTQLFIENRSKFIPLKKKQKVSW